MGDHRFRPKEHLRRPADFRRVYDGRASASDNALIVYAWPNALPHNRLGLSVSRKHGGAVVRNRIRRLLREAYRLGKCTLPTGFDLVIVPRSGPMPPLAELVVNFPILVRAAVARAQQKQVPPHADPA
ncbi:MAG: ribonuclease P protein component [Gemmataceae bacterium]